MKMQFSNYFLVVLAISSITVLGFQNCSKINSNASVETQDALSTAQLTTRSLSQVKQFNASLAMSRDAQQFNPPALPINKPTRFKNVSIRGNIGLIFGTYRDQPLILGFTIEGTEPKQVLVRGLGRSVRGLGLDNPYLQLFSGSTEIAHNDNWDDVPNKEAIIATGLQPWNQQQYETAQAGRTKLVDSAILMTLNPGAYTALVSCPLTRCSGLALVDVTEINSTTSSISNVAGRAYTFIARDHETMAERGYEPNSLIVGFTLDDSSTAGRVLIRARGPSLSQFGVPHLLADPVLDLFAAQNGNVPLLENDNWQQAANAQDINATGLAPTNNSESAILTELNPGSYLALVGKKYFPSQPQAPQLDGNFNTMIEVFGK